MAPGMRLKPAYGVSSLEMISKKRSCPQRWRISANIQNTAGAFAANYRIGLIENFQAE